MRSCFQFCRLSNPPGITPHKLACGNVYRVRHIVPGGSREPLPQSGKVRFADKPEPSDHKRVLYEQVTGVKWWSLFLSSQGLLLLLLSLRRMLLSTGFVFAL
jgi:hypothetical protein